MTETQRKVLAALVKYDAPIGPNAVGEEVWGHLRRRSNGSAPYARVAGKALNALRAMGLVNWVYFAQGSRGWEITTTGRRALEGT